MTICVYCRGEITSNDLIAKNLGDNLFWCNRCKEGAFGFYDRYSIEELSIMKNQLLGTVLYFVSNSYIVATARSTDLISADMDARLQDIHNITNVIDNKILLEKKERKEVVNG